MIANEALSRCRRQARDSRTRAESFGMKSSPVPGVPVSNSIERHFTHYQTRPKPRSRDGPPVCVPIAYRVTETGGRSVLRQTSRFRVQRKPDHTVRGRQSGTQMPILWFYLKGTACRLTYPRAGSWTTVKFRAKMRDRYGKLLCGRNTNDKTAVWSGHRPPANEGTIK